MNVKINTSKVLWTHPEDNSRKLYEVSFECEGKNYTAKTWSKTIGEGSGNTFDVESEKKPNKQNPNVTDVFIKQINKGGGKFFPVRQDLDKKLASLVCAKDLAIARFGKGADLDVGKMLNEADEVLKWLNK